eukprot:g24476.t1
MINSNAQSFFIDFRSLVALSDTVPHCTSKGKLQGVGGVTYLYNPPPNPRKSMDKSLTVNILLKLQQSR